MSAAIFARLLGEGATDPRELVAAVDAVRRDRTRFVMALSRRASDSLLLGADPVATAIWKTQAPYINDLRRLYLQGT